MIRPNALLAAAAGLLTLAAKADQPLQLGLALRTGYSLCTEDKLNPLLMGVGLTLEQPLTARFTLKGELAYLYKPGRQYLAPLQPAAPGQPQADPNQSADLRKNQLDALVLRLGGAWTLGSSWSWVGGLQIGNSRFSQQVVGQTEDTSGSYTDTYNATPVKSTLAVSPFLGLQYEVDADSVVDVDLLGLAYTAIDFRHTPGSPLVSGDLSVPGSHLVYAGDHYAETSRMNPTVEISYRFRF